MVRTAALVSGGAVPARDMLVLPALLPGLRDLVLAQLPHYSERCVANTLHSAAVLDMRDRELLGALADAAVVCASELTPQGLANIAWAFGRLRLPPPPRLAAALFAASAGPSMACFNPQELADMGWAVATLHLAPPPGWDEAWLAAVGAALAHARGGAVSRLLWAAARMGLAPGRAWLDTAWTAVARQLPGAPPRSASIITWAVCRLWRPVGGPSCEQLAALLARMERTLGRASAADVTVTLGGLAAASTRLPQGPPTRAAAALLARGGWLLPGMDFRQTAHLLWAAARLGLTPAPKLLQRAATRMFYRLGEARATDLAMGLWALARLGLPPPTPWAAVIFAQVRGGTGPARADAARALSRACRCMMVAWRAGRAAIKTATIYATCTPAQHLAGPVPRSPVQAGGGGGTTRGARPAAPGALAQRYGRAAGRAAQRRAAAERLQPAQSGDARTRARSATQRDRCTLPEARGGAAPQAAADSVTSGSGGGAE
jgi:hypothetical protein